MVLPFVISIALVLALGLLVLRLLALRSTAKALTREKERARLILSGSMLGTWERNLITGEWHINDHWAQMLGYTVDEVLPNADALWQQSVHPDDLVRIQNVFTQCLKGTRERYSCDVRVRHKDGREIWVQTRGTVLSRLPDGRAQWVGGAHSDITDAKNVEQHLRDAEAFLQTTGRVAGVGSWQLNLKTMALQWNDQTCEIHGQEYGYQPTLEEMLDLYPPEARASVEAAMQRAQDMGVSWDMTLEFLKADHNLRWVRLVGEVEFDDSGAVRLLGSIQDVTSQHESQLAIKRSEAILREAIDTLNEAFVLYDPQDRLVFCNDRYRQLYGSVGEVIVLGATFEEITRAVAQRGFYPQARENLEAWVQVQMEARRRSEVNEERQLSDGRWLRVLDRRMADGHVVGFRVDITELKNQTAAAQAVSERLALTTMTLQAVLDSAVAVGVIATGVDRVITVFNRGSENLLGYTAEEMVGKRTPSVLFDLEQLGALQQALAQSMGRTPTTAEVFEDITKTAGQFEWNLVRKDGSSLVASMAISPMRDSLGTHLGFMAVVHDITQQKVHEASLQEAMELANQSNVAKSQFLANMSHEIRTPMNAILGMLKLMHKTQMDARQSDYIVKAENAARALLGLLNDILDFSKVEAGKLELELEPFSVEVLTEDLSVILTSNLGLKNVNLVFDIDPALPRYLVGDVLRLQQVLINLGGNAVKFTEAGAVTVRMEVMSLQSDRVQLQIAVQDTGIGIAPENQARVFQAFTQAESNTTRRFGGTGLGLVIATRLVRLMGGELELQSRLGEGSTFSFCLDLPYLAVAPDATAGANVAQVAVTGGTQRLVGMRILLVEDNPINQQVAQELLSAEGATLTLAENGQMGVDLLAATPTHFHAVLMDLQMPVMDGLAAARHIRSVLCLTSLPLIAMTANAMASDRVDCQEAGMNDHVGKPFDLDGLVQTLVRHTQWTQTAQRAATKAVPPQAAMVWPDGIDGAGALARLGGDVTILQRTLQSFVDAAQVLVVQVQGLLQQGDFPAAQRELHSFKGLAATVGARALSQLAAAAEKLASDPQRAHALSGPLALLQAEIHATSPDLRTLALRLQAVGGPQAASSADSKAHREALHLGLTELMELLRVSDLQAMEVHAALPREPNSAFEGDLSHLDEAMSDMDFEQALHQCELLLHKTQLA
jgi:PAS domain S-box-containing protein